MKTLPPIAALLLALAGAAYAQTPQPGTDKDASAKMLAALPLEDLISKLQEESAQGIGSHTTALASGFLAIDDEPRFHGGILGSAKPVTSPVMRELVRRGLDALPALIAHLTDARPTKLTVGNGFMGKWFADEYAPRYADPSKQPAGVNKDDDASPDSQRTFDTYTLKVGDFCYVAAGQIVNRQLNAVRYQPSLCLVVNSPVETPALAAAVKADWGGLTAAEHQHSLEQDAISLRTTLSPGDGLKRLFFYYPESGEPLAVKILDRPFFDGKQASNFLSKNLVPAKGAEQQDKLMGNYRKKRGETNYLGVLEVLLLTSTFPESQMDDQRRKSKAVADSVLHRLFPDVDPLSPPFINAVEIGEQQRLLEDLSALHSKAIDDAVTQVLRHASEIPLDDDYNHTFTVFELARDSAQRLVSQPEHEAVVRSSLEKIISAMLNTRKLVNYDKIVTGYIMRDTKTLRELLAKLPAKPADDSN